MQIKQPDAESNGENDFRVEAATALDVISRYSFRRLLAVNATATSPGKRSGVRSFGSAEPIVSSHFRCAGDSAALLDCALESHHVRPAWQATAYNGFSILTGDTRDPQPCRTTVPSVGPAGKTSPFALAVAESPVPFAVRV